jgi:hypothetical protein
MEQKRTRRQPPVEPPAKPTAKTAIKPTPAKPSVASSVKKAVQSAGKKPAAGKKKAEKVPAERKIKAPPKAVAAQWGLNGTTAADRIAGLRAQTSRLATLMAAEARTRYNDPSICVANESLRLIVTLPVPALSLEYLLGNNGLPLGNLIQLVGLPGSCKSGMVCEMGNWFMNHGGAVHLHEHESKYSPVWINSIIGYDENPFLIIPANSVDEWQRHVNDGVKDVQKLMLGTAAEPGPGVVFPYLMAVDSILGKPLESTQKKLDEDGATGRRFATEAASMKDYLSTLPSKIIEWPFTFVMVNHLKLAQEEGQNQPVRKKQGGSSKEFLETMELQMTKRKDLLTTQYEGAELEIQIFKNSLARGNKRKIHVAVHWWDDPESSRQYTRFLWDSSTVTLLLAPPDHYKSRLKEVIDITKVASDTRVWSKRLGIPKESSVDYEEAGKIIHADQQLMADLRKVFGISVNKVYQPGVDYRHQRNLVAAAVGEQIRKDL